MSTSPAMQRALTLVRLVFHLTLIEALLAIGLIFCASNRRLAQDDLDFAQRLKAHSEAYAYTSRPSTTNYKF